MPIKSPTILALDFDGVLCDGLLEYFQTSWRTYCQIWHSSVETPPDGLDSRFYRLRPVIETGWEMPILIRALLQDIPETRIVQNWSQVAAELLAVEGLDGADVGRKLDTVRDEWIASDLASWLGLHRFYPGVVERLRSLLDSPVKLVIISTKEGRFIQQLFKQQGLEIPVASIIGKEAKRPKYETLRQLGASPDIQLWFVEDLLKTLVKTQQESDLNQVKLFLADWGYNTPDQQESIRQNSSIHLLSLSQFVQDFSAW